MLKNAEKNPMKPTIGDPMKKIATLFILFMIFPAFAMADVIVLKSGDKFKTRKAWEEDGKIKFYMKGMVVGIDKRKVDRIIKSGAPAPPEKQETGSAPAAKKKEKTTPEQKPPSKQAAKTPPEKQKPPKKPARPKPQEKKAAKQVKKAPTPKKQPAESPAPPGPSGEKTGSNRTGKQKEAAAGSTPGSGQPRKKSAPPAGPRPGSGQPGKKIDFPAGSVGFRGLTWDLKAADFKKRKKKDDSFFGGIAPFFLSRPEVKPGEYKTELDPAFGGVLQYYLPKNQYRFGRVKVDGITYGYWRDQFYSVTIWIEGFDAYKGFKKEVFKKYGEGWRNNKKIERWVWIDESTQRMLEYDSVSDAGILVLMNRKLHRKIKRLYDLE